MKMFFDKEDVYNDVVIDMASRFGNDRDYVVGLEINEENLSLDMVAYRVGDMLEIPKDLDEFHSIVEENGLDKMEVEDYRETVIKGYA